MKSSQRLGLIALRILLLNISTACFLLPIHSPTICATLRIWRRRFFLLIYRNLTSFNNDSKLSTWIYRITINKCLSYRRSIARRKNIAQIVPIDNTDTNKIKDNQNVEKSVLKHENDEILRSEIYSMGNDYSVVIHLKYYESLGNKEIAEILGLPIRTVETRIYRAKKRLRKRLEKTNYRWEVN